MEENEQLNNDLTERLAFLNAALARKYARCDGDRFLTEDGRVFFLTGLRDDQAVVVEYADSTVEASVNRFEDGDLFFLDELPAEEMLAAILAEIEDNRSISVPQDESAKLLRNNS